MAKDKPETIEQGTTTAPAIVRKITAKDVMGSITAIVKEQKLPLDLFTVVGQAKNLREGESTFGPWVSMVGEFEAVNMLTGEVFYATECFIPGPAGDLLIKQVRTFVVEDIPTSSEEFKKHGRTFKVTGDIVEMALIVGIKEAKREGGAPYEFVTKPIVEVRKADVLASLRDKVSSHMKLLAAPKK